MTPAEHVAYFIAETAKVAALGASIAVAWAALNAWSLPLPV